ncbi:MAG TPA: hypothetical protein VFC19_08850, partial [Candidatus Limnocylindrales bacterium]|nr:hypothetical protein [Candidatus Limnocylindrales bacterium]
DMLTTLRRTLIAARFMGTRPAQPTNAEIRQVREHEHSQPHRPRKSSDNWRKDLVASQLEKRMPRASCAQTLINDRPACWSLSQ